MGNQASTDTLCTQEWDKYLKTVGESKEGWNLILDDSRNVNIHSGMTKFLAHFTDLLENLFLGCKAVLSENVHRELVDVTVKRMEELINFDYKNCKEKNFYQVIPLLRSTDDNRLQRKTEMILVLVVRITADTTKKPLQEQEEPTAHIENSIKVRMRSKHEPDMPQTFNNFC